MFSGIRSLIFGAYEEDSSLSTIQPNVTAAQLLPSLQDQQREEEEQFSKRNNQQEQHPPQLSQLEHPPTALVADQQRHHGDVDDQQTSTYQVLAADDAWELVDFHDGEDGDKSLSKAHEDNNDIVVVTSTTSDVIVVQEDYLLQDETKSQSIASQNEATNEDNFLVNASEEDSNVNRLMDMRNQELSNLKSLTPGSQDPNHRSNSSTELENLLIENPTISLSKSIKGANQTKKKKKKKPIIIKENSMEVFMNTKCTDEEEYTEEFTQSDSFESKELDMLSVVTPVKGKNSSTSTNRNDCSAEEKPKAAPVRKAKKIRQKARALSKISPMQSSIALCFARTLSPPSRDSSSSCESSPSPLSSDNEINFDTVEQENIGASDNANSNINATPIPEDIVAEEPPMALIVTDQQFDKVEMEPLEGNELDDDVDDDADEMMGMINNENRLPARTMAPIQLFDEHPPYWQKKKKRQQRRNSARKQNGGNVSPCSGKMSPCSSVSDRVEVSHSSPISSAGIINRIGSSIVANITNLTTTLPSVPSVRGLADGMRKFAESVDNSFQHRPMEHKLSTQRKLAKSTMAKQNKRMTSDNSNRRIGRRAKMFVRANGVSIDRKQTYYLQKTGV